MKLSHSKSLTFRIAAVVVLISAVKCNFEEFPIPVGLYTKQFMICGFGSHVESCLRVGSNKFYLFSQFREKSQGLYREVQG